MRTLTTALALTAAALALAACGGSGAGSGDAQEPAATPDDPAEEITITGTLAGDAQLEGGCVWVETADGRYEVRWPDGWRADVDPIELRGPDGEMVAGEGDEVRVAGEIRRDVATVCQVGTVLDAADVAAGR